MDFCGTDPESSPSLPLPNSTNGRNKNDHKHARLWGWRRYNHGKHRLEGVPLQIGCNPNFVEGEAHPLDWSSANGPPQDYTTQDEGIEHTEYDEDNPQETYDQEEEQEYERDYRDSDSRALVVASPPRVVESRGLGYGPLSIV